MRSAAATLSGGPPALNLEAPVSQSAPFFERVFLSAPLFPMGLARARIPILLMTVFASVVDLFAAG